MDEREKLEKQVRFIVETERLKSTLRTAWTASGRQESTAEHSWRLALLTAVLAPSFSVDMGKALTMCLIHDLGELYGGDISAAAKPDAASKQAAERRDAARAFSFLPEEQTKALMALWEAYEENATPEARLVKALDKAETIIQHCQGENPPDFDYAFNLGYGKEYFQGETLSLLRQILNAATAARIEKASQGA